MKEIDFLKLRQWVNEIRFFCDRVDNLLDEHVKHQQEELRRFSETGKKYMNINQQ